VNREREDAMKKLVIALTAGLLLVFGAAAPAAAQCPAAPAGDPGRSEYANQHIVVLAQAGVLGQGHKPGTHLGASNCAELDD
jgi:hypothetical protein